jgi:glycogen debranching enzyme
MSIEPAPRWEEASEHETPFYIPATAASTRSRCTLKHGDMFIVVDGHGDIGASAGGPDGLFQSDTRFLSHLELLLNGMPPLPLGSNIRDDNSLITIDLTNPDIYFEKENVLQKDTLHLLRTIFLWRGIAYHRLSVRNYGEQRIQAQLTFTFGNDFADLFEVRGMRRKRRGTSVNSVVGSQGVLLHYEGLDARTHTTMLRFEPPPDQISTSSASYRLELDPDEHVPLFLTVGCDQPPQKPAPPFLRSLRAASRERKAATSGAATIETSNALFNEVLCRAMADLTMLTTDTPQGRFPYAGIPWYSTTFGRDSLITAMETLWLDPGIARGVLRRLAAFQANKQDLLADAEPGKILHEMRAGEMAALREVPFGLYYGSVDSTPLFVMLAGLYDERTRDDETLQELWPAIENALAWIDGPADPDHDGFVEYHRATEEGLANQGWKDSYDAIFHADGSLAHGPIALVEVQGYVCAAKRLAANCARRLGYEARASELAAQAERLAAQINEAFWCPEIDTYALALDGAKEPCRVRTSNAGHLLFTGVAPPHHARTVATRLLGPECFSGWGIRTVATSEVRYNPMSYHNGSVWPHDNALVAAGLARYGMKQQAERVFSGLFEAAMYMELERLPELFCGFRRERGRGPTLYPVACAPQAWASGAPFLLLQACLGLDFDPARNEVKFHAPALPPFLDRVVLRNLRLHASSVDVSIWRHNGNVSLEVLRKQGPIKISVEVS